MSTRQQDVNGFNRLGILYSGGASAGMDQLASAIASYAFQCGTELIGFRYGWTGLIRNDYVQINEASINEIGLQSGGQFLGSCSKVNVFDHNEQDYSEVCYQTYKSHVLSAIFVLGGDGSSRQANELSQKYPDMKFVWISATLDCDVPGCDYTIGFFTAVNHAAETIANMVRDGATMRRHVIIECMGRHSGWVTAYAAELAMRKYGVKIDMILVPEVEFDLPAICNRIKNTASPLAIVISEGIEHPMFLPAKEDNNDANNKPAIAGHHASLAYTCSKLVAVLQAYTDIPIKAEVVGYSQRTGIISDTDLFFADQCAKLAIQAAQTEVYSSAIIFKNGAFQSVSLVKLTEMNKTTPDQNKATFLSDVIAFKVRKQLSAGAFRRVL